jgi:hypothetical protein
LFYSVAVSVQFEDALFIEYLRESLLKFASSISN